MASLTPAEITKIAEPLEEIYQRMTDELLTNIAKHFKGDRWQRTRIWEIKKLGELGALTEESVRIISKESGRSLREIEAAFLTAARISTLDIEPQFRDAAEFGILNDPRTDLVTSPAMIAALESYVKQATDTLNLTNTTMLESTRKAYVKAVETVANTERLEEAKRIIETKAAEVITRQETRVNAIRTAMDQMNAAGITGFYDKTGRQWSAEAYVSMVIKTTSHNAGIAAIRARQQEYGGGDVFQISSHSGARPLCYPYQGKFYSWSGAGTFKDGSGRVHEYENINSTSYGMAAGIFGINCGHHPIPMIDGYSYPQEYEEQTPEENAREYAESQKQRAIERDIREAKRQVEVLKATGDEAGAKLAAKKVRMEQARMRQFIDETGRARRYDRERIVGVGERYVPPANPVAPPQLVAPQKVVTTGFGKAVDSLDTRHRDRAAQYLNDAPEAARRAWNIAQGRMDAPHFDADPDIGTAYFDPYDEKVHFESPGIAFDQSSYQTEYQAYFHEYGHNIDYLTGFEGGYLSETYNNGVFGKTLYDECGKRIREFYFQTHSNETAYDLVKAAQDSDAGMGMRSYIKLALREQLDTHTYLTIRPGLSDAPESRFRELFDTYLKDTPLIESEINALIGKPEVGEAFADYVKSRYNIYQRGDISDMFERYYVDHYHTDHPFGIGHGSDYAQRRSSLPHEAFAEMYSATATGNESLDVIKEFFPESYQIFLEMLGQ